MNKDTLLSVNEASKWASKYIGRDVTPSNISYLIQYAKVTKFYDDLNNVRLNLSELKKYYDKNLLLKQKQWKEKLGNDLNWALSFDHLKEADTTKHVHRLHPYKGKFIPQLTEYFLNDHINTFKKQVFFNRGDIILDPFVGSGTTLVQCSELGLHSIGIDVSQFNCLISKVKTDDYNIAYLESFLTDALDNTIKFSNTGFDNHFEKQLKNNLSEFNKKYFPGIEFRQKIKNKEIDEEKYGKEKLKQFLKENEALIKNGILDKSGLFSENDMSTFLTKWFPRRIKQEMFYYIKLINKIDDEKIRNIMRIILSRVARSCRATAHFDLATLKNPQFEPYYCRKHKKICAPTKNILKHLKRYTSDTIKRLKEYSELKNKVYTSTICGDSREINISNEIKKQNPDFYKLLNKKMIDGIFTSPPYIGQIDYHQQHAYAYELFGLPRKDDKEIGPLFRGKGKKAKEEYIEGISRVLLNISKFVKDNGDFFIVANDKYDLYPRIAEKSNLLIVDRFRRPVLNRTERDRQPYAETIFHMKKK